MMGSWRKHWLMRRMSWVVLISMTLFEVVPPALFASPPPPPDLNRGLKPGQYQALSPALLKKVEAKRRAVLRTPDVRPLNTNEMKQIFGRGVYRNKYLAGTLPWQRSLRDVNLCSGNLFKSFTDIQVAPAKGAGLALQRTYNSDDDRIGPFGVGWTHAYDIRMEEEDDSGTTGTTGGTTGTTGSTSTTGYPGTTGSSTTGYPGTSSTGSTGSTTGSSTGTPDMVDRTDFFGGKHRYHRDADGLYTPPVYLYDQLNSDYQDQLVNGPAVATADTETGEDGTIKHFIANGNERDCDYIQDRHGNRTTLTYGENVTLADGTSKNLLTQVTDPSDRQLNFTWTNLGTAQQPAWRITQVQGPQYRVVYSYYTDPNEPNAANDLYNLEAVTLDPDGVNRTTTYTYTSASGPNGTEYGLLASISDPLGHTVSYQYTVGYYDINENFVSTPTGSVWVSQITEPGSGGDHIWTINVDIVGGQVQSQAVDNDLEGPAPEYSLVLTMLSDSQLRFVTCGSYSDPSLGYSMTYDTSNNVLSSTRVNSGYLNTPTGGPYATTPPQDWWPSVTDNYTYGPHGNVLTHTISGEPGVETTTYYDADKYFQKASVTDMNGHTTTMDYYDDQDPNPGNRGEVKWVEDARYGTTGKQFTYTYNAYGQKASEVNLNGVETDYSYGDQWGNLTQVVQDPGTGHLNRTTNMIYDVAGHVLQSTDPMSLTSSFSYNNLGQPLTAAFPAKGTIAGETISYGYGANGRTESVTDNRGTTTMAYENGNDRVSSVTDPVTGTISYTYGLAGERKTMTLPGGGTWTYLYHAWNPYYQTYYSAEPKDDPNSLSYTLEGIQDDQGREVDFGFGHHGELCQVMSNQVYDGGGNLVSYDEADYLPDGGIGNASHGWLGELTNTYWVKEGSPYPQWVSRTLSDNKYTYDNAGNRLTNQITLNGGTRTETYGYDELNRLTSVNYGDGGTQTYSFDNMGNRLTKNDSGSGNESYGYNAANMLLTRGSNSYSNDPDGNTLTGGGRTNTWDSQNRLVNCVYGANTSTYVYSANGLRHRETTGGVVTDFVLDGQHFVRELQGGVPFATYLDGPSGPLYRRDASGATLRWYIYDGLGSVLGEVDQNGSLDGTRTYDVYGLPRSVTGVLSSKHAFVGNLGHTSEDETGLVYMRSRYMDPVAGRFLSEDPARRSANWYCYASSDPTNRVDATGRCDGDLTSEMASDEIADTLDEDDAEIDVEALVKYVKDAQRGVCPPDELTGATGHGWDELSYMFEKMTGNDMTHEDLEDLMLQWNPKDAFLNSHGNWQARLAWYFLELDVVANDDGEIVSAF